MKVTRTFNETAKAFNEDYRLIINRGGTRSGKSFAILQLLFVIAISSKKKRIITCISHSFPHLQMGIVRDFDNILIDSNINPSTVSTKRPYIYHIGNSIIEFTSVDNIGKALGAARDILFVNECNRIPHSIYHQLMVRTKGTIFLDFNPDGEFWLQDHKYGDESDSIEIKSTYLDNIENLTDAQIHELDKAKKRADKEKAVGKFGYWSYWWRVYGEGELGRMVDRLVYPSYNIIEDINHEWKLQGYFMDFGFSQDPTAFGSFYTRGKHDVLIKEGFYKKGLHNINIENSDKGSIEEELNKQNLDDTKIIVCESAEPKSISELRDAGFQVYAVKKQKIVETIRQVLQLNIYITKDSINTIKEFDGYMWPIDKDSNVISANPIGEDHILDGFRYFTMMRGRVWDF